MRARCGNPQHPAWKDYGGRGIKVCDRWSVFESFLEDMGARPPGLTLDRLDNDGNYEPGNCAWRTQADQVHNRRHPSLWRVRKLNVSDVHQIRWLVEMGYSKASVSRMYGVTDVMVGLIVRGEARNYEDK